MPLTSAEYFPDPAEPVDRWFQAQNASNPRTTADLISSFSRGAPGLVIDPFCGSGSTASAARLLGLPFYGIEADPVLACISLAKALAQQRHAGLLPSSPDAREPAGLASALTGIARRAERGDARVASALAVLAAFRDRQEEWLGPAEVTRDLAGWPEPVPASRVIRGDALSPASWERLSPPPGNSAVLYTSPPFGPASPAISPPAHVRAAAIALLAASGADALPQPDRGLAGFAGYASATLGMLRQAVRYLAHGTLIIEHEPDDEGADSTSAVLEAAAAEFAGTLRAPRILRCGAFSRRGMLSLIIFDVR